jgi:hypothetical protein
MFRFLYLVILLFISFLHVILYFSLYVYRILNDFRSLFQKSEKSNRVVEASRPYALYNWKEKFKFLSV